MMSAAIDNIISKLFSAFKFEWEAKVLTDHGASAPGQLHVF
eukprot:gene3522-13589_t